MGLDFLNHKKHGMDLDFINNAKEELHQLKDQLDAMITEPSTKKSTLQGRMKKATIDVDALDKIEEKARNWFVDRPECEHYVLDLQDVYARLTILYKNAESLELSILCGNFFVILQDDLELSVEDWLEDLEDLDPNAKLNFSAIDCIIESYLELGEDFKPDEDQMLILHDITDALEEQYPESWRLEVDNLRRKLELCKVILSYEDDNEIKDLYIDLCMELFYKAKPDSDADRSGDTEEDAEKFHFIKDITKDKAAVYDYFQYATTIDNLSEEELNDIKVWMKYFE